MWLNDSADGLPRSVDEPGQHGRDEDAPECHEHDDRCQHGLFPACRGGTREFQWRAGAELPVEGLLLPTGAGQLVGAAQQAQTLGGVRVVTMIACAERGQCPGVPQALQE